MYFWGLVKKVVWQVEDLSFFYFFYFSTKKWKKVKKSIKKYFNFSWCVCILAPSYWSTDYSVSLSALVLRLFCCPSSCGHYCRHVLPYFHAKHLTNASLPDRLDERRVGAWVWLDERRPLVYIRHTLNTSLCYIIISLLVFSKCSCAWLPTHRSLSISLS